jgi:hypothetical protein
MPENDSLDRLIDSALATYASQEADSELAQRVLDRVSIEAATVPRRGWLPWAIALPVATGLLLLAVLSGPKPSHRPGGNTEQANQPRQPHAMESPESSISSQPSSSANARTAMPRVRRRLAAVAGKPARLPKLDTFPTPQPLTPAERTLAEYAAHAPEAERQALLEAQKQIDNPLSIAAIEIKPLEPSERDSN